MASVVLPPVLEPLVTQPTAEPASTRKPPAPINLIGTDGADTLSGNKDNNIYAAGAGADLIKGSAGNDSMGGGSGIDTLDYSGLNADITFSRGGVITKSGGMGVDTIAAFDIEVIKGNAKRINTIDGSSGTTAALNVDLSTNSLEITGLPGIGSAKLTVINFSNVNGSENNDVIVGNDKANSLNGGGGNDTISGGGGDDLLLGSSGTDVYGGGSGADTLSYETFAGGVTLVRGGTVRRRLGRRVRATT